MGVLWLPTGRAAWFAGLCAALCCGLAALPAAAVPLKLSLEPAAAEDLASDRAGARVPPLFESTEGQPAPTAPQRRDDDGEEPEPQRLSTAAPRALEPVEPAGTAAAVRTELDPEFAALRPAADTAAEDPVLGGAQARLGLFAQAEGNEPAVVSLDEPPEVTMARAAAQGAASAAAAAAAIASPAAPAADVLDGEELEELQAQRGTVAWLVLPLLLGVASYWGWSSWRSHARRRRHRRSRQGAGGHGHGHGSTRKRAA